MRSLPFNTAAAKALLASSPAEPSQGRYQELCHLFGREATEEFHHYTSDSLGSPDDSVVRASWSAYLTSFGVDCLFDPAEGMHFCDWTADGFKLVRQDESNGNHQEEAEGQE